MMTAIHQDKQQSRGRLVFILLAIFFALPVLIVTLMYRFEWHPPGSSQGELVVPPKPILLPKGLIEARGQVLAQDLLRDKWSMVYIADECDHLCLQRLQTMRQIHASMAKDTQRIQRILLTRGSESERLLADYPDLIIINQPTSLIGEMSGQFHNGSIQAGRIYLVDPLANLMMRYPDTVEPKSIRKDLVRLLKAAWAG